MGETRPMDESIAPDGASSKRSTETLFREYNDSLLRFLRARLGNDADAQEAAQEAYARLLQLDNSDQPSFLRAYLFKIATNVATDMLRHRRVRGWPVAAGREVGRPASQESALEARQQFLLINEALKQLPARCRQAFILNRQEGWSSVQIAAHLNVSDRMVRLYLIRAMEHLEAVLASSEGGSAR